MRTRQDYLNALRSFYDYLEHSPDYGLWSAACTLITAENIPELEATIKQYKHKKINTIALVVKHKQKNEVVFDARWSSRKGWYKYDFCRVY